MNKVVEKYYDQILDSIKEYGVSFRKDDFFLDPNSGYYPVVDTLLGNSFFTTLLSGNGPMENLEIILQTFTIYLGKKIKKINDIENNQIDKNGSLQIHFDQHTKRILIITENMDKSKIFQNHDYEEGNPILLINQTGIKNLGKMKKINFDLWIGKDLERFAGLETVKGKIILARNSVKNFDTLREVDEINLNDGDIESLGSLEIINGNCRLGSNLKSLGKLKFVGGDILIQSNKLFSLENLEVVGKRLRIRKTNVIDLGKLKKVGEEVLVDRKPPDSLVFQLNQRGLKFKKG